MDAIRVLVVDDHREVRRALRHSLQLERRIRVVGQASSGREAVDKTERFKPNVVLMDVMMPQMNGLEAAHLIKQQNPETKVIILSLYNQQHLIAKAKTLGVSRYMTKDQPMEEIVQTIISVCEGTKEH